MSAHDAGHLSHGLQGSHSLYCMNLLSNINLLYQSSELCDVILLCDGMSLDCHKIVLAAASDYFKTEFMNNTNETNILDVSFSTIETLKLVIRYIYTGLCEFTLDNVCGVLQTSDQLQLCGLISACEDYVMTLDFVDLLKCFNALLASNCKNLADYATERVQQYLTELLVMPELEFLNVKSLMAVLEKSTANTNEDVKLKIILKRFPDGDCDGLEYLFAQIKFENLSTSYLCDIQNHKLMQQHPQLQHLKSALAHHLKMQQQTAHSSNTQSSASFDAVRISPSPDNPDVGTTADTSRSTSVPHVDHDPQALVTIDQNDVICLYDWNNTRWQHVMDKPSWMDGYSCACTCEAGLIVCGSDSIETARNVCLINLKDKHILNLPNLPFPIQNAGVTCSNRIVSIAGGYTHHNDKWVISDQVYCLNLHSPHEWKTIEPLAHPVGSPIVLSDKNRLYILGGRDEFGDMSMHSQVYEKQAARWHYYRNMLHGCTSETHSGVVLNDNLICIITPGFSMTFNLERNSWCVKEYDPFGSHTQVAMCTGDIMVCMYEGKGSYCLYRYELHDNEWFRQKDDMSVCGFHRYFFSV